jgi:dUTP pyrophosphatase
MEIELKLLDRRLEAWGFPHWGSDMAAGLDLFACLDEPLSLEPQGPPVLIPAGFALSIGDPGWAALIYPRSGAGHRRGLVLGNTVGIVDADYQGPVLISAWNRNPAAPISVEPGERIAQMVLSRVHRPRFRLVEEFTDQSRRGAGGFGSTGAGPGRR